MTILLTNEALATEIAALKELIKEKHESAIRATDLARTLMEQRMDGFPQVFIQKVDIKNELSESRVELVAMKKDIQALMDMQKIIEGKASQQALMIVLAVAMSGMFFGAIGLIMRFFKV